MAKAKSAKEKLTAFFKGKGLNPDEIKDAFIELDEADADLEKLVEATARNEQWAKYWTDTIVPEFQKVDTERNTLKGQLAKLEAAGIKFGDGTVATPPVVTTGANGNYVTKEDLTAFRQELASASSDTMKQLIKINSRHYSQYNQEVDFDALEKLMNERDAAGRPKYFTVEQAYGDWSRPVRHEHRDKKQKEEVDRLVREKVQAELSKQGVAAPRRKKGEEIENNLREEGRKTPKSYTKLAPEEKQAEDNAARQAFLSGLSDDVTH